MSTLLARHAPGDAVCFRSEGARDAVQLAAYAAAKGRIFVTQQRGDHAVVPAGDELCLSLARAGAGTIHTFWGEGAEVEVEEGPVAADGDDTGVGMRSSSPGVPVLSPPGAPCAARPARGAG